MDEMPRTLAAWLDYQHTLNPNQIELGLERLRPIAVRLALQARIGPLIVVAGTNGKGSTVAMLEALSVTHGVSIGSYTSPHLLEYSECVRIDGTPTDEASIVAAFERVERARGEVPLTAFEFRTLAAIDQLAQSAPELTVLEVGLGGRLDAVNVMDADVSVVTSIGLDHMQWLGGTLEAIAREKCGIVRAGMPVVTADAAAARLIAPFVAAADARLIAPGHGLALDSAADTWTIELDGERLGPFPPPRLPGEHQVRNAAAALVAFRIVRGAAPIDAAKVRQAVSALHLQGRLERVGDAPERWLDVAHNAHAADALARWMAAQDRRWLGVCAMYADKDAAATLAPMLEQIARWYLAPLPPPRGGDAERLADALRTAGVERDRLTLFDDVASAWNAAAQEAVDEQAAVIGFGSFETVRAVLDAERGRDA